MTETEQRAADGLEEAAAWSTVGIVCGSGGHVGQGIGSGIALRWRGHHLIVTAEHVISDTRAEDLRFLFRPQGTMQRVERGTLLSATGVPTASLEPVKEICFQGPALTDAALDLAAIPVDAELEHEHPVRFFDLAAGGTTPPVGQTVLVAGYPSDITRVTRRNERVAFGSAEWTQIEPNRDALEGFDPARHVLAEYPMRSTEPDAHPGGFSGSAWWYQGGPKRLIWYPNLDVAGVTVAYYRRPNLLKAVRREVLEAFLTERIG